MISDARCAQCAAFMAVPLVCWWQEAVRIKGGELADHTTNVFCSSNKKARPAMRCKVSSGVTGRRETRPSPAWWGLPAQRRKREIREHRTQSYCGWEGGGRGEESIRMVVVCYRLLQVQLGRGKCYHTGKMEHNWAEPPWSMLHRRNLLFQLRKSRIICYLSFLC